MFPLTLPSPQRGEGKGEGERKLAATIGVFDGVHRGHQKILKKLIKEAARQNAKSLVITFHPHPREVLNPESKTPLLTSLEHRLRLIGDMGVEYFYVIKFTKSLSRVKANDFIKKILIHKLDIKTLVVGENFLFGYKGRGNFALLKKMSKRYNLRLFGVKPMKMKTTYISSTRVRSAIEKGDLKQASLMLARPVIVFGTVIKGKKIGRRLGFPTANINPHHEAIPPSGVYAVNVRLHKRLYKGILNIGTRPTFGKDREPTIELHILNFKKDIYGKDIEIIFKRKIRNERRFSSAEALQRQINKDILRAK